MVNAPLPSNNEGNGIIELIKQDGFNAYATFEMFSERIRIYRRRLKLLSFLSLLSTIMVGGVVGTYGTNSEYVAYAIAIAAVVNLLLLPVSLWSIVSGWESNLSYALESAPENKAFHDRIWEVLHDNISDDSKARKWRKIREEAAIRNKKDDESTLTEGEKRYGHRAALRQLQLQCVTCKSIPSDLKSTKCGTCGNFWNWRF